MFKLKFFSEFTINGPITARVSHTDSSWKLQPYNCKPLICWTQLKQKTPVFCRWGHKGGICESDVWGWGVGRVCTSGLVSV